MEKTPQLDTHAHWEHVHADYLSAHREYLRAKLAQEPAHESQENESRENPARPTAMLIAKDKLRRALLSIAAFFQQHAEYRQRPSWNK